MLRLGQLPTHRALGGQERCGFVVILPDRVVKRRVPPTIGFGGVGAELTNEAVDDLELAFGSCHMNRCAHVIVAEVG